MNNNTIIHVENLSKQYRLGVIGTGTLSHDINRWWYKVRGKDDPYIKVGHDNDRNTVGDSNYVWALQNIDFEVQKGDVFGIIGKNGAGKSTLLKILSQVTAPTTGTVKYKGRIASLLEVGTGFHPELTGRENIFLNGAILGMRKYEINQKLDEIVEFSGVAKYIDTPVKRYSSGMLVRLAFSVAAHLDAEILVVDEVLAVGDSEFQKKCLGKLDEVRKSDGRTVLFVSHNMESLNKLCEKSIYLKNGMINSIGETNEMIRKYLSDGMQEFGSIINLSKLNSTASYFSGDVDMIEMELLNSIDNTNIFRWSDNLMIRFKLKTSKSISDLVVALTFTSDTQVNIFTANNKGKNKLNLSEPGIHIIDGTIEHNLRHGVYSIHLGIVVDGIDVWWNTDVAKIEISQLGELAYPSFNAGLVLNNSKWSIQK